MFPNFELRNVFTLALVVQWIAHQNNMSMKEYIILYCKTGGYRVNFTQIARIRWAHVGSWWKCGRGFVNIGPTSVQRNIAI